MTMQLGSFSDPEQHHQPIKIAGCQADQLSAHLRSMLLIRKVEQQLALGRKEGVIGGPVHLGAGQEAIAVGVATSLRKSDRVFGAHRSHSHLLSMNPDPYSQFAEVLGKESGFSKGMGGSMHLWDQPSGFYGSVPIVSGTVSLAVGAAIAAKMQQTDDIAVSYFGDGAAEEGVVHESLNLARIQQAPVLFVVENNLFASHMHISQRQPVEAISRFAVANDIPYQLVDGNDVVAVEKAASALIERARAGGGPGFLEVVTYRWYGHVDWRDDIDVGVNRSLEDVENWHARDPVLRLKNAMKQVGIWSRADQEELEASLDQVIQEKWEQAMADPYPPASATLDRVYAESAGKEML